MSMMVSAFSDAGWAGCPNDIPADTDAIIT